MADDRVPYNSKYCKEVKCSRLHGNKCLDDHCTREGNEKRAIYFTTYGVLANGDIPDARFADILPMKLNKQEV